MFIIVLLVVLLLSAILYDVFRFKLTQGQVVEKQYEPERRWVQLMPTQIGKITVFHPIYHYDDEDWVLVIEGKNDKGKTVTERLYVSQETWDAITIGEWYEGTEEQLNDTPETHRATQEEIEKYKP